MTDISLCRGCDHTLCKSCVRYTTLSNDTYQSYILGRVIKGECLDFWPVEKQYRKVDNIGDLLCAWLSSEPIIYNGIFWDINGNMISYNPKRTCKKRSAKSHKRNKRK